MHFNAGQRTRYAEPRLARRKHRYCNATLHHGCVQRGRRMVEASAEETTASKRACERARARVRLPKIARAA